MFFRCSASPVFRVAIRLPVLVQSWYAKTAKTIRWIA